MRPRLPVRACKHILAADPLVRVSVVFKGAWTKQTPVYARGITHYHLSSSMCLGDVIRGGGVPSPLSADENTRWSSRMLRPMRLLSVLYGFWRAWRRRSDGALCAVPIGVPW
jgi:hypothetical protein